MLPDGRFAITTELAGRVGKSETSGGGTSVSILCTYQVVFPGTTAVHRVFKIPIFSRGFRPHPETAVVLLDPALNFEPCVQYVVETFRTPLGDDSERGGRW